jgi:hypothetical protein
LIPFFHAWVRALKKHQADRDVSFSRSLARSLVGVTACERGLVKRAQIARCVRWNCAKGALLESTYPEKARKFAMAQSLQGGGCNSELRTGVSAIESTK